MPSRLQGGLAQAEGQIEERHGSSRPLIVSQRRTVAADILDLNSDGERPSAASSPCSRQAREQAACGECRKVIEQD